MIVNGTLTKEYLVTPEERALARDREDWKQGRRVTGIEGVQVGNETITFLTVILSSVPNHFSTHALLARIETCPGRPSGFSMDNDTSCMAYVFLECESFPEDTGEIVDGVFIKGEPSRCNMDWLVIVWDKHYLMDDDLLAVTAGLYSSIRPSTALDVGKFFRFGILGALFALGTLDERPSIEVVVRPVINGVYVCFIVIPVALAVVCYLLVLALRNKALVLPETPYDFMVFGKENEITTRRSKRDKFPGLPSKNLELQCCSNVQEGAERSCSIVQRNDVGKLDEKLSGNALLEHPISDDEASSQDPHYVASTDFINNASRLSGDRAEVRVADNDLEEPNVRATNAGADDEEVGSNNVRPMNTRASLMREFSV